jgi:hypothetical protein
MARAFHQLRLYHLAQPYYERVLDGAGASVWWQEGVYPLLIFFSYFLSFAGADQQVFCAAGGV